KERFGKLLNEYYQFLKTHLAQTKQPGQFLDLLPFNIILNSDRQYQWFDQEWAVDCEEIKISAEFILFRALLWFGFAHDSHIGSAMKSENLTSIAEFISFGFQLLALEEQELLPRFIAQEGQVQHSIDPNQGVDQVQAVLKQSFQQAVKITQTTQCDTQLFWVTETTPLSEKNCINMRTYLGDERQTLFFPLPDHIEQLKILRFDPSDRPGFLHIHRLTLRLTHKNAAESLVLWEAVGSDIAKATILKHIHYCSSSMRDVFFSIGDDPQLIIELPESVIQKSSQGRLQFEAVIDWPQSSDYLAILDEMQTLQYMITKSRQRIITVLRYKLNSVRRIFTKRILGKIKLFLLR
ncbi:MAG: hypothetical protein D3907_08260, partial [Candidatus Electrothrix sp. AUS3]|nr:hypothetical protein [Candidatus Electrothrix gigas]